MKLEHRNLYKLPPYFLIKMFDKINDSYMEQIKNYLVSGAINPKNNSKDAKNIKSMVYKGSEANDGVVDFFPVFGKTGNQAWSNTKFHTSHQNHQESH